jgi:aerotaxis receptor
MVIITGLIHVTPVLDNGKTVGYESIRTKPHRDQVARTEKAYEQIQKGKSPLNTQHSTLNKKY